MRRTGNMRIWRIVSPCVAALAISGQLGAEEKPNALPPPEPPFRGEIRRLAKDSKPDFPKPIAAPKGAPNVLLIMTDDVGFGASSTFGGPIPTPTMDRIALA